ncbi:MAG: FKBP-type peptidyl-prolyl cis-trans isomerase [Prevotellaceae bacterium]|jgi:FKBP-type peptidyl-prolyl cis-trans isomerase SlyD|nr:FKBP-type peptidyl-prolyl cis-trans isomerase [Prevotellaceae bacterium]
MKVENNKVVSLSYILEVDGKVIETVTSNNPMQFIFGTGRLLPKFEHHIEGKEVDDIFDFTLKADEAYGMKDPEAIIKLSKEAFRIDGEINEKILYLGNHIPMRNQDGHRMDGIVELIQGDTVTMNFNHPLAGQDLHFKGEVVAVRDTTPEDFANTEGCGCGCSGDCGDAQQGCGDGCGCQ